MQKLTEQEIKAWKEKLDAMSQMQLASLQRFAEIGHPVFRADEPLYDYFREKQKEKGGMTPAISKAIGWTPPSR